MSDDLSNFLPVSKKLGSGLLADSIIGIRPDESWDDAIKRFIKERRVKKLKEIFGEDIFNDKIC